MLLANGFYIGQYKENIIVSDNTITFTNSPLSVSVSNGDLYTYTITGIFQKKCYLQSKKNKAFDMDYPIEIFEGGFRLGKVKYTRVC